MTILCDGCGKATEVYVLGENCAPGGSLCLECSPSFMALRFELDRLQEHLFGSPHYCNCQNIGEKGE